MRYLQVKPCVHSQFWMFCERAMVDVMAFFCHENSYFWIFHVWVRTTNCAVLSKLCYYFKIISSYLYRIISLFCNNDDIFVSMKMDDIIVYVIFSGGNKRKLSTAIALVGNPPIVFLVSEVYRYFDRGFQHRSFIYIIDLYL